MEFIKFFVSFLLALFADLCDLSKSLMITSLHFMFTQT